MKRILSLVLAVLMLASLAISASAITVPFKNDSNDNKLHTLIQYHKWYYLYGGQAGNFEPLAGTWYDECPACDGLAEYFTYEGKIVWYCLDDDSKIGFLPIVETTNPVTVPSWYKGETCPRCESNKSTIYTATGYLNGKLNCSYFCAACSYSFYKEVTAATKPGCNACHKPTCTICHNPYYCYFCTPSIGGSSCGIIHNRFEDYTGKCPDCNGKQTLQFYYTHGEKEYGFFMCTNGHAHAYPKKSNAVVKPVVPCYFCGKNNCAGNCYVVKPGVSNPGTSYQYDCFVCDNNLIYQFTYTESGVTYAYYKCKGGHAYSFLVSGDTVIVPPTVCQYCNKSDCKGDCYIIDPGFSYPDYTLPGIKQTYDCTECDKQAEYVKYFSINGKLYGHYECENGHTAAYPLFSYSQNLPSMGNYYKISVMTGFGGTYKVEGGEYAVYGQYKTINFTPKKGYILAGITVNGKPVDAVEKLTIKITANTVICAYFAPVSTAVEYAITTSSNGNGTITATLNGKATDATAVKVSTADTITYKFTPNSANYKIVDVKIDGKSVGAVSTYTFKAVKESHTVYVEFQWKNPYNFIASGYEKAVEYVTETGIMEPLSYVRNKPYFGGTNMVSVKTFAMALAEMADVKDALKTDAQREAWAKQIGLILDTDKADNAIDVQTACRIVDKYLEYVQTQTGVKFVGFDAEAEVLTNAVSIGLATENGYTKNRTLTRYDLASVCYLIKGLSYSVN